MLFEAPVVSCCDSRTPSVPSLDGSRAVCCIQMSGRYSSSVGMPKCLLTSAVVAPPLLVTHFRTTSCHTNPCRLKFVPVCPIPYTAHRHPRTTERMSVVCSGGAAPPLRDTFRTSRLQRAIGNVQHAAGSMQHAAAYSRQHATAVGSRRHAQRRTMLSVHRFAASMPRFVCTTSSASCWGVILSSDAVSLRSDAFSVSSSCSRQERSRQGTWQIYDRRHGTAPQAPCSMQHATLTKPVHRIPLQAHKLGCNRRTCSCPLGVTLDAGGRACRRASLAVRSSLVPREDWSFLIPLSLAASSARFAATCCSRSASRVFRFCARQMRYEEDR